MVKKTLFTHQQIIINSIWFSEDGSVAEEAIYNLLQLAKKIKTHPEGAYYKVFFWTDPLKLQTPIQKRLSRGGIVIKDYRAIHSREKSAKHILSWIQACIALGNQDNKYFYCLASDLFRLYLLLHEFPHHANHAISCYIDCNDIEVLNLPSPTVFKKLATVAFHFTHAHLMYPLGTLLGQEGQRLPFFTNDVILVANKKNRGELAQIYKAYYSHLKHIDQLTGGLIEILKATRAAITKPDRDLALVIVICISHTLNLFRFKDDLHHPFLLEYEEQGLRAKPLQRLDAAQDFINFNYHSKQGLTWAKNPSDKSVSIDSDNAYRQFWYQLYISRYHSISQTVDAG